MNTLILQPPTIALLDLSRIAQYFFLMKLQKDDLTIGLQKAPSLSNRGTNLHQERAVYITKE